MASGGWRQALPVRAWLLWLLVGAMAGLFVFDVVVPTVIVMPLVCIPVVISAVWFSPRVVASLAGLSVLMALVSGWVNDYFSSLNDIVWMAVMVVVGLVAVAVAFTRTRLEAEREEVSTRLQATLDSLLDPHVALKAIRDSTGRIVDFVYTEANPAACLYNHMPREELVGARLLDVLPGHLSSGLLDTYRHVVETGEPLVLDDFAYEQELRGGEERRYDIRGVSMDDSISYTWRDVTDRSQAVRRIRESEERYRLLAQNSTDVVLRSRDNVIVWVSPSLTAALDWKPEQWVGHAIAEFIHLDDLHLIDQAREQMLAGLPSSVRARFSDAAGDWHWIEAHSQVYRDADGRPDGFQSAFRVVDKEVEAEGLLERRATYDDLTGALKRGPALQQLHNIGQRLRTPGDETALLFIDIDDFKHVNDSYGHAVGDALLRRLTDVIRDCIRAGDTVARMGGDEFLVILTGLHNLGEATSIAEKIRTGCAEPMILNEAPITATVSVGVTYADPNEAVDNLVARADEAMYQAKAGGRNRVTTISERVAADAVRRNQLSA